MMSAEQQRIGIQSSDAHRSNDADEQVIIERSTIFAMNAPTESPAIAIGGGNLSEERRFKET